MVNETWLGDCLELMQNIPDASIDMILCDLPYGITGFDWDKKIDLVLLWEQYKRIIKPHRAIVLTATQPFASELIQSNKKWFRTEWIWHKNQATGFLNANKQPLRAHENILVFCEKQPLYNPQKTKGKPYTRVHANERTWIRNTLYKTDIVNNGDRYPKSVQEFAVQVGKHKTQKPLSLCEYFIKTYSNEGDLILDNCAGSGTTGVAAKNSNRDYLMIEKDPDFYDVMQKRLIELLY